MNQARKMLWQLMAVLCLLALITGCGKKMVKGNAASNHHHDTMQEPVKSYGKMDSLSSIMKDGLGDNDPILMGESTITSSQKISNRLSKKSDSPPGADLDFSLSRDSALVADSPGGQDITGSLAEGSVDGASEVVAVSLDPILSNEKHGVRDAALHELDRENSLTEKGVTFSHNLRDVHFEFDSWRLAAQAREILEANAEWLKTHPHEHVTIEGHCDERGTQSYNYVLGEKRAAMVQQYLSFLGVPLTQLHVASFGKDRPACRTMSADCFEQNRRAHFQTSVNMVSQQPYSINQ